jgi:hypothetical protein
MSSARRSQLCCVTDTHVHHRCYTASANLHRSFRVGARRQERLDHVRVALLSSGEEGRCSVLRRSARHVRSRPAHIHA